MKKTDIKKIYSPTFIEGVLWALAGIKNANILFHSPGGCYVSQVQTLYSLDEPFASFYTSNLDMPGLITSGEQKLKDALGKINPGKDNHLFIVDSVPAAMTKEDIKGIAKGPKSENTTILTVDLDKTSNEGKDYALMSLLALMQKDQAKKDRAVNIIGPTCCMYNWRSDIIEIKRMLKDIGISVNAVLSAGSTVKQIKKASQACLNLCIYPYDCGLILAKEMESQFGIPYISNPIPIGFENSAIWLENIAEKFSLNIKEYLAEQIEYAARFVDSNFIFSISNDSKLALSVQNHNTYAVGISEFLQSELGMESPIVFLRDKRAYNRLKKEFEQVLISPSQEDIKKIFIEECPTIVLGSFYDFALTKEVGIKNFLYADIPMPKNITTQSNPYMGFRGAVNLVHQITTQTISNLFINAKSDFSEDFNMSIVKWESSARTVLSKIGEMIPYFVRTVAIKKINQEAQVLAQQQGKTVDVDILKQALEKNSHFKNNQKLVKILKEAKASE